MHRRGNLNQFIDERRSLSRKKDEEIFDLNKRIQELEKENKKHKDLLEKLEQKITIDNKQTKELSPIRRDDIMGSVVSQNFLEDEEINKILSQKSRLPSSSENNLILVDFADEPKNLQIAKESRKFHKIKKNWKMIRKG
ncbi:UNKNOWN [Stylonychia lemnae]|uniref:Uncharacterized protein n=1 Tax=Stylonychia lemnae TaxID=5949 RepID=A0A078B6I4_STYLE|nr:UNKNOWN [Stylonychia lemnae]|eukprot:CDW90140.1 UNKNOWN [Stylonychia lemnae]